MRGAALLALAVMHVAGAAGAAPGPTYTRASVAPLSTAELAALLLDPADAATVERHWIGEAFTPSDYLQDIHFVARARPLGPDICGRDTLHVSLTLADPADWRGRIDPAVRAGPAVRETRIALAPGCADLPGRRFASIGRRHAGTGARLNHEDGIRILRALAAARAAAARPGPLPFRLRCGVDGEWGARECPADLRALLAGLPLHRVLSIDRPPFVARALCGPIPPMTGDSVEIDAEGEAVADGSVWEVRLRDWGAGRASITFNRAPRWDNVAC
ncbi:MAG: hypothetical protein QOD42_1631 [Sphingomonadales bacterium]|jgi:hypothetical protein|nr:hypothetical protein [Sphingomonadales bacterium]